MSELKDLNKKKLTELTEICDSLGIDNSGRKNELIERIIEFHSKPVEQKKTRERVKKILKSLIMIITKGIIIKIPETGTSNLILNLMV
jgi:myosin heavy subunit